MTESEVRIMRELLAHFTVASNRIHTETHTRTVVTQDKCIYGHCTADLILIAQVKAILEVASDTPQA